MLLFNRKNPRLCLMAGLILCGAKWWFNWVRGEDKNRKAKMLDTEFGLLDTDPNLVNAWDRLEGKVPDGNGNFGILPHNLTNLAIEWNRRWGAYGTKFIASWGVWSVVVNMVLGVILIAGL